MAGSSTAELQLRPTGERDLAYVLAAEADPDNAAFLAPATRADHLAWTRDPAQRHLVAEAGGRRVGFAILRLHRADSAVELRRLAVTEEGHGRAARRLVITQSFEQHGAHRLWLDVEPHNERALALYRSAGFVEEGLLRDALFFEGGFQSLIVMSILRPEWQG